MKHSSKTVIVAAVSGLALLTACGPSPDVIPPGTGDGPPMIMPSEGATAPPLRPKDPAEVAADMAEEQGGYEYSRRVGDAIGTIGELQDRHEGGIIPGWYMGDEDTIVLWVTDRARVQKMVDQTGYADLVELRETDVSHEEVMTLVDQVVATAKPDATRSFGVGPDYRDYPLVVARLPQDTSPELIAKVEAMATPRIDVQVQLTEW